MGWRLSQSDTALEASAEQQNQTTLAFLDLPYLAHLFTAKPSHP